ncbi:MAG: PilC/PilY family type IV pilus protein [Betaproteobacteria bacterium]
MRTGLPVTFRRLAAAWLAGCAAIAGADVPLADAPLFSNIAVPGNLALALSVEFPTAVSVAHTDVTYAQASTYLGYFDPDKCYAYQYSATETSRYFYPTGAASSHACSGRWSGNFLNWATMQTIDPFRWALTGGYRVVDTASDTILEKAWASGQGGAGNFPNRTLSSASVIAAATPFSMTAFRMRIQGLGNRMRFSGTGNVDNTPTAHDPAATFNAATVYEVSVRVRVCVPAAGLESNCKAYSGGNYKPEGLMQRFSEKIRFSAFAYLNDSDLLRDGGVLRARQKFIGPKQAVPGSDAVDNAATEWDSSTGVMKTNPDPADATSTTSATGVTVSNSGVLNYLNKFGQITPGSYKTYDNISELYYAAIRYFKNQGNVSAWSSMGSASSTTKTTWVDGFPVITTWDDPILYSCQRNFILGIGDVNTWADKNLPGSTPTANEPAKPAEVTADTTVDAVTATNKVGSLEGLGSSLGTTNPYNGCCGNNSALLSGLAYDANTVDIRPDDNTKPNTLGWQTIQTYWLDILEFQAYKNSNQFYLAAKYGGFTVPSGFSPYTHSTALPESWWRTNTDTLGSSAQPRPDNYFVAGRPDQMVAGLTSAMERIASSITAFTSAFSNSLPQVAVSGSSSYAAQYDSVTWNGEVVASSVAFDTTTGDPTLTTAWTLSDKLATQLAGTGWNTGRRVISWDPGSGAGIEFRHASLTTSQKTALDTSYRTTDDSADYVNYLRGERLHENTSTDPASSRAYRGRTKLLGDIVGSRVRPVGPPALPLSETTNAGYAQFKGTTQASRTPMIYFGANDGMLHAVNGLLTGADAGKEVFAYVPSGVITGPTSTPATNGLASRGNPSFSHRNFVNATPVAFDLDFTKTSGGTGTTDWRTVLIGGLGSGGRSYYALDITDPSAFSTEAAAKTKVLWEFTHTDLGYTFGEAMVAKTRRHGWVVLLPSGYNNTDGQGYLFVVNPRTGALIQRIATGAGSTTSPAGLAHVNTFILDRTDGTVDAAYAGDLLGNLWRFDLTATTGDFPAPTKIAQLTNGTGSAVPVTTRPLIEVDPKTSKRYVLVGTGRLLATSDIVSTVTQNYFSILDGTGFRFASASTLPSGVTHPIQRSNLAVFTDTLTGVTLSATQMGWALELGTGTGGIGWRVVTDSAPFFGVVAFASTLTSSDACNPTGEGRIYALDIATGKSVLTQTTVSGGIPTTVNIGYCSGMGGTVTDLRFMSVNGTGRLIAGNNKGQTKSVQGSYGRTASPRRINWRELPAVD